MQLTKDEIEALIAASYEPAEHGVRLNGEKLVKDAIAAHAAKVLEDVEPFMFEEYPYNSHAMGCGLEDRDITDRYEAMAYGWDRAMERAAEAIPDDLYPAHTVAALAARVAELEKDALRYRLIRSEMAVESGLSVQRGKSRRKIVVKALMAWWPGVGPVASGSDEDIDAAIDAAHTAKGQA